MKRKNRAKRREIRDEQKTTTKKPTKQISTLTNKTIRRFIGKKMKKKKLEIENNVIKTCS